jgi:hypothetical protein
MAAIEAVWEMIVQCVASNKLDAAAQMIRGLDKATQRQVGEWAANWMVHAVRQADSAHHAGGRHTPRWADQKARGMLREFGSDLDNACEQTAAWAQKYASDAEGLETLVPALTRLEKAASDISHYFDWGAPSDYKVEWKLEEAARVGRLLVMVKNSSPTQGTEDGQPLRVT